MSSLLNLHVPGSKIAWSSVVGDEGRHIWEHCKMQGMLRLVICSSITSVPDHLFQSWPELCLPKCVPEQVLMQVVCTLYLKHLLRSFGVSFFICVMFPDWASARRWPTTKKSSSLQVKSLAPLDIIVARREQFYNRVHHHSACNWGHSVQTESNEVLFYITNITGLDCTSLSELRKRSAKPS